MERPKIEEVFSHERMKSFTTLMCNLYEYSLKNEMPKTVEDFLKDPNLQSFMGISRHVEPIMNGSNSNLASFMVDTLVQNALRQIEKGKMNQDINFFINKRFKAQFKTQMKKAVNLATKKAMIAIGLSRSKRGNENSSSTNNTNTNNKNIHDKNTGNLKDSKNTTNNAIPKNAFRASYSTLDDKYDTKVDTEDFRNQQLKIEKTQKNSENTTEDGYYSNKNCNYFAQNNFYDPLDEAFESEITDLFADFVSHDEREGDSLIFSDIELNGFDINFYSDFQEIEREILEKFEGSPRFNAAQRAVERGDISVDNLIIHTTKNVRSTESIKLRNRDTKERAATILNKIRIENKIKLYNETFGELYEEDYETEMFYFYKIREKLTLSVARKVLGLVKEPENHDNDTIWGSAAMKMSSYFTYDYKDYSVLNLTTKSFIVEMNNGSLMHEISESFSNSVFSHLGVVQDIAEVAHVPDDGLTVVPKDTIDSEIDELLVNYDTLISQASDIQISATNGSPPS